MELEKFRLKREKLYILSVYLIKWVPILLLLILTLCFEWNFIVFILCSLLWWFFSTIFFDHRDIVLFSPTIRIWFGVPGSGKTSVAAYLSMCSNWLGYKVLSNVNIKDTYKLSKSDLGVYDMSFNDEGCHVLFDEGSIDFDNRNYKEFAKSNAPQYFALHRHQTNRVDVFSQGYDIDKRIRDRAGENGLFLLRKCGLKGFVCYKRIRKYCDIDKEKHEFIDGVTFKGLPRLLCVSPAWSKFDTLDKSLCPKLQKEWELWND